jgi:hypothetical protein
VVRRMTDVSIGWTGASCACMRAISDGYELNYDGVELRGSAQDARHATREFCDNPFGAGSEIVRTVLFADRHFSATE